MSVNVHSYIWKNDTSQSSELAGESSYPDFATLENVNTVNLLNSGSIYKIVINVACFIVLLWSGVYIS